MFLLLGLMLGLTSERNGQRREAHRESIFTGL